MKTSELTGAALDRAVAKCEGHEVHTSNGGWVVFDSHADDPPAGVNEYDDSRWQRYSPSTDWAQGGPIIEREGINLDNYAKNPQWSAWTPAPERESGEAQAYGPTPLVAAMRCFVASKLGDEVDVPDELTTN